MKKLLALILALTMILTLAACGAGTPSGSEPKETPESTGTSTPTGETEPSDPTGPEQDAVTLVGSYRCSHLGYMTYFWEEYTLDFTYSDDLTGGTVILTSKDIDAPVSGQFTCDEGYNITRITLSQDSTSVLLQMNYDDSGRLVGTKITLQEGAEAVEELIFQQEAAYNEAGQLTRSYTNFPRLEHTSTKLNTYDDQGRIVEETTIVSNSSSESYTKIAWRYDENGAISGMESFDAAGNSLGSFTFTPETVDGQTVCTAVMDGQTMSLTLDAAGRTVVMDISVDGISMQHQEYVYDQAGNLLSQTISAPTVTYLYEYTYNDAGIQCGQVQYQDGAEVGRVTTTYITVQP